MKKTKVIKKGFSLIEILISLGVIVLIMVSAFTIYNTVKNNQAAKSISEDFKYTTSKLEQDMNGITAENLMSKRGCCEMIYFIDSLFPLISEKPAFGVSISAVATKKYKSPLGGDVDINLSYTNSGEKYIANLTYVITGGINTENCTKILSQSINTANYIYIAYKNKGATSTQFYSKVQPKNIAEMCSNDNIKYISMKYSV